MEEPVYLVPHDFTDVAAIAVEQATKIAALSKGKIALLHICSNKKEVPEAKKKLQAIVEDCKKANPNVKYYALVETGSIFTDIGKTAEEFKASLIIMGTHGAKGMQKVFGSFAIKVIGSTHVPFMVVQSGRKIDAITRIIFPIDVNIESLQIMGTAKFMAKAFGAEIHLVAEKHNDTRHSNKVITRFKVVVQKLKEENIPYVAEYIEEGSSFQAKILEYAKKVDASMVAASYDSDKMLAKLDKYTQTLITNEQKLPCLVIHAKAATSGYF